MYRGEPWVISRVRTSHIFFPVSIESAASPPRFPKRPNSSPMKSRFFLGASAGDDPTQSALEYAQCLAPLFASSAYTLPLYAPK